MWDAACKRRILHTKGSGNVLLVGDHLVQSCMILALIAVLRKLIAHNLINVRFIKGLVHINLNKNDILLRFTVHGMVLRF